MVQFVVQSILEAGVYLLAVFAFYGYVRPHSKAWITRKIRQWGEWLSERRAAYKFFAWFVIISVTGALFLASRIASWNQIFDDPLKRETVGLADSIDRAVDSGTPNIQMFNS